MAGGNRRIVQGDFSAGAFPATSFENIPANGVVDAVNLLVDDDRSLKGRGGSRWAAAAMGAGTSVEWMWSGVIGATNRTIVANSSRVSASNDGTAATLTVAGANMPWRAPAVSFAGLLYMPAGQTISPTLVVGTAAKVRNFYAVAGNRLWAADYLSNRVDFSDVGVPGTFGATSFHEIAEGGILGMIGLRDALVVFTTAGVWVISNVGMNLTDSVGNVQHRIDRYSRDLILPEGGSNGLGAAYESALVVPASDGVYLMSYGVTSEAPQAFTLISRPISSLWQSYMAAGYMPGQPVVRQRTLFLPVRSTAFPGAVIDVLVCRLDMPTMPWTRLAHTGTGPLALARSAFTGNLIGGGPGDDRLMTLDYFAPSLSTTDADGAAYTATLKTRSPVGVAENATLARARVGYELDSAGAISGTYTDSEGTSLALAGTAGDNMAALDPVQWRVGRRARYSSLTLQIAVAATRLVFRSVEWFVRDRGRV
jgi:hypothetical protein